MILYILEFWKPRSTASPLAASKGADTTRNAALPKLHDSFQLSTPPVSPWQANSPYQVPPANPQQAYHIQPPVTSDKKNNYLSLLSPMSPMLVKTEYENMPLAPTKPSMSGPPVVSPVSSQSSLQSYPPSRIPRYEPKLPNRTYQSWGAEMRGDHQSVTSRESIGSVSGGAAQRQPIRYSTQSERDSLMNDAGKRFPPPSCSPPPPPPPNSTNVKDNQGTSVLRPHGSSIPLASRQSDAYYKPHEYTKNGHTQMFSSPPPSTSAPPIPTKTRQSGRNLSAIYPSYQMPFQTQSTPAVSGVYAQPTGLPTAGAGGYSTPSASMPATSQDDQKRLSDSGVCLLEPVKVSGQPALNEDPLQMFDPLVLAEASTVEAEPRVRLPSISLKSNENLNANSSTVSASLNSNNRGAKPDVLTGNLITLYDEDLSDVTPEPEDSKQFSDEEDEVEDETVEVMMEEMTAQVKTERESSGSGSSCSSDLTSGSEIPSGSKMEVSVEEGQEPEEASSSSSSSSSSKKTGKTEKSKRKDPRKGLANMKKSFHKMGNYFHFYSLFLK